MCSEIGTRDWISRVACNWQAARRCTRVKHAEKLNCYASCSTTRQKVQISHLVSSRLKLATQSSHQLALFQKNDSSHFKHTPVYIDPYTHKMQRASRENFERETLEKNKIDSSTIFSQRLFKFIYSHPLHCYILERFISQILFSPYPYL